MYSCIHTNDACNIYIILLKIHYFHAAFILRRKFYVYLTYLVYIYELYTFTCITLKKEIAIIFCITLILSFNLNLDYTLYLNEIFVHFYID